MHSAVIRKKILVGMASFLKRKNKKYIISWELKCVLFLILRFLTLNDQEKVNFVLGLISGIRLFDCIQIGHSIRLQ